MNLLEKIINLKKISKLVIDTMNKYNVKAYMLYYNELDLTDRYDKIEGPKILKLYIPNLNKDLEDNLYACFDGLYPEYSIHVIDDLVLLTERGYRSLLVHHGR